ncbi:MAG: DUF5110 domain-containing protein, partial [Clostridia bacterium]|nr:DUF5110 domain-containing protein [Clostridia bacterium]
SRLMPYIYSTAWQVTKHRETFIRLLAFDFADDKEALAQGSDSYLFGHTFLISPVTKAMYYEGTDTPLDLPKEKDVYLPAGCGWYDFWTEKSFAGGQYVKTPAPMDSMPIYVRSGSILPMTEPMQYVDEIPDAPYEITVYPGADGHFTVYEDSGDSYDYESGAYAEYDLCWNDAARTLTVSARRGTFEGMAETRTLLIRAVGGKTTEITYSGKAVTITL